MKKSNIIVSIGLISILILSTLVANASSVEVTAILRASPKTESLKEKMKIRRASMQKKIAKMANTDTDIIDPSFLPKDNAAIIDPLFKKSDIELLKEKLRTARTNRKVGNEEKPTDNANIIDPLFNTGDQATSGAIMDKEIPTTNSLAEKAKETRKNRAAVIPATPKNSSIIDPLFLNGKTSNNSIIDPAFKVGTENSIIDPLFRTGTNTTNRNAIIDPLFKQGTNTNGIIDPAFKK